MQLAMTDLFRAKWTNEIHEEWISNLLEQRPDIPREALDRTKALMNAHVRDCLVDGYQHLTETIAGIPDPGDRHIVAAAYHCGADAIVTFNLKDFPGEALRAYRLEAIHPDDFVWYQTDLNLAKVIWAVRTCRQRLKAPPLPIEDYLQRIEACSMPKTVAVLRQYAAIL